MGLWYNHRALYEEISPFLLDWLVRVSKESNVQNVIAWHETMSQHWETPEG
jgi:hypothetical protein